MKNLAKLLAWTGLTVTAPACSSADAAPSDADWRYYNGTLSGERFSALKDIRPGNLADLKENCEAALGDDGSFESGPLVIGDTLFATTEHTTIALNATDCSVRWRNRYTPEEDEQFPINRGAAYMDGRVFRGTGDGRLLAIDATTGKELWRVHPRAPNAAAYFSAAPIVWKGLLVIGPAASDSGIRGYVAAFDVATGKQVWRFNTVPTGNERGADTWRNREAAQHGGGGTWSSYTLDGGNW
jgi:alcohol dehydrogenase (cytochrome c)